MSVVTAHIPESCEVCKDFFPVALSECVRCGPQKRGEWLGGGWSTYGFGHPLDEGRVCHGCILREQRERGPGTTRSIAAS